MNWILCIDPKLKHYTFFHHSDLLSCVKFHKKLLSSPLDSWSSVKLLYSCCLTVTPKYEFVFACLKATLTDIVSNSLKASLLTSLSYCNNFKNRPVLIVLSSSTLNGLFCHHDKIKKGVQMQIQNLGFNNHKIWTTNLTLILMVAKIMCLSVYRRENHIRSSEK